MSPFDVRLPILAAEARVKPPHLFHLVMAMREMGAGFHKEAYAQFAGLEVRHVDRMMEALDAHKVKAAPKREGAKRGTRLPHDWELPDDWAMWAIEARGWLPSEAQEEGAAFGDYWHSRSGTGAAKVDWRKTWQNWVRNSRRPDGNYKPSDERKVDRREQLQNTIRLYERMGRDQETAEMRRELAAMDDNVVQLRMRE